MSEQDDNNEQRPQQLTHLDTAGAAHMVDVAEKSPTRRRAEAESRVLLGKEARQSLAQGNAKKGDVLAAARFAGIQAAKQTSQLIPLCHPLRLSRVALELTQEAWGVRVLATVEAVDVTGVEMEAMTAASVAALTIYDMLKGLERGITIESVRLLSKSGGRSGTWSGR